MDAETITGVSESFIIGRKISAQLKYTQSTESSSQPVLKCQSRSEHGHIDDFLSSGTNIQNGNSIYLGKVENHHRSPLNTTTCMFHFDLERAPLVPRFQQETATDPQG